MNNYIYFAIFASLLVSSIYVHREQGFTFNGQLMTFLLACGSFGALAVGILALPLPLLR